MILSDLLLILRFVNLLIEPLSVVQLIAAGVFIISGGAFSILLRTHLTYILTNKETNQVYVGRSSGFGKPTKVLRRRMYGHAYIKKGFDNPKIDKAIQGINSRPAIRGREQQLIDFYGGIANPKVANKIRAVSKQKRKAVRLHKISSQYFGELHIYTGN